MVIGWFIAFVILLLIELVTVNLVTIWFAIGAIAAIITTIFTDSILIQSIVFVVVSVIALLITKPLIKKFKKFEVEPTNSDRVIGKVGDVTKKIDKNKYGEVKVYGNTWTASSKDVIEVGERVKVLSIDGVKLIVEKEKK
ncbi:MAG: NfeD family protein [Bacilli bacterium]|nr:NfeD family protein [Bacilli bacterium]